jgi:hypothetical protein
MTRFELPENFVEDLEALIRRTGVKLKKCLFANAIFSRKALD